ncbi:MAG: hypothetical protein CM15mP89_1350 [Gammaproteobacteria bacterium]|nr:MAG: hypothetical protein CM15mP89_1350 [Gammaproteobacteria bacterium]
MSEAGSPYVVLSSPLLLESGQSAMVDVSVVVDVPEALQIERTMARDQNDRQLVEQIMAAQLDRETRIARADMVIDNSTSLDHCTARGGIAREHCWHARRRINRRVIAPRWAGWRRETPSPGAARLLPR